MQGGDRLDHQDRHDQEVVDLELQSGDREIDADRQHGRRSPAPAGRRRIVAPSTCARDLLASSRASSSNRSANRSARPMARIGLMPVRVSVNLAARWRTSCRCSLACTARLPNEPAEPQHCQQGDGNRDQQQLPGEQSEDGHEHQDLEDRREQAGEHLEAIGRLRPTRARSRKRACPPTDGRNSPSARPGGCGSAGSACRASPCRRPCRT